MHLTGQRLVAMRCIVQHGRLTGGELLALEETLPRGTIYTTLRRLKDDGLVTLTKKHDRKQAGPPRVFYEATALGHRAVRAADLAEAAMAGA